MISEVCACGMKTALRIQLDGAIVLEVYDLLSSHLTKSFTVLSMDGRETAMKNSLTMESMFSACAQCTPHVTPGTPAYYL